MKKMKKVLAMAMALSLGITAGCGGGKDVPTEPTEETTAKEKITVSVHPSGHGLPAYVAEQNGYYEEEGLEVETLVYIGAPPQMEAYEASALSASSPPPLPLWSSFRKRRSNF